MKNKQKTYIKILYTIVTLILIYVFIIFLMKFWPLQLLNLLEKDASSIPISARIAAESALRNSLVSVLAGIAASAVAVAALRQAALARKVHVYQRNIDWSKAFAESTHMLSESNPIAKISGVANLRLLAQKPASEDTVKTVVLILASFIRNNTNKDKDSVRMALDFVCSQKIVNVVSLRHADLSDMDLSSLTLENMDLSGASLRGSKIDESEKKHIQKYSNVDMAQITWLNISI